MFTKFAASILFAALSLCAGVVHAQDKDMCKQFPFGGKQWLDCKQSSAAGNEHASNVKAKIEANRSSGLPLCSGYNALSSDGYLVLCEQAVNDELTTALKKAGCGKLKVLSPEQKACVKDVRAKFFD